MTPIEAAAREIESEYCQGNRHDVAPELVEIITRHLFPVVKTQDVEKKHRYWCLIDGDWYVALGWADHLINDAVEIRGPIPMPEVRS